MNNELGIAVSEYAQAILSRNFEQIETANQRLYKKLWELKKEGQKYIGIGNIPLNDALRNLAHLNHSLGDLESQGINVPRILDGSYAHLNLLEETA